MKIELTCVICSVKFLRTKGEVNRNAKIGRQLYCSRTCAGKGNIVNISRDKRHHPENLRRKFSDEYSIFRVFMHRIIGRKRKHECNLTLEDLKHQWEIQKGICSYTGWKLTTPKNTGDVRPLTPSMASLDRIDSSKGYLKGNIEFVSFMAQCAKNNFNKNDVFDFCLAVSKQYDYNK